MRGRRNRLPGEPSICQFGAIVLLFQELHETPEAARAIPGGQESRSTFNVEAKTSSGERSAATRQRRPVFS